MTTFSGFGPGKKGGPRRLVLRDGELVEDRPRARGRRPSAHLRFQPFTSYQPHANDRKALGLRETPDKGTYFGTERELNNYLSRENDHGRPTGWKQH